jgi:hypothetical protein
VQTDSGDTEHADRWRLPASASTTAASGVESLQLTMCCVRSCHCDVNTTACQWEARTTNVPQMVVTAKSKRWAESALLR